MITERVDSFLKPSNLQLSNRTIEQFKTRLQPGEVIKGRVIGRFENSKALVNFKGFNVVTEVPEQLKLSRGESINARVLEVGDKIIMRLVRPDSSSNIRFTATVTDILNDMNLPVNEETNAIVKTMIQYDIPLTAENIESVLNYAFSISGEFGQSIDLVVLAWLLGLTPNSRILNDLKLFNSSRTPLGEQLNSLKALLTELVSQDSTFDTDLAQNLMELLGRLQLVPEKGELPTQIRQFLENLGLEYERTLLTATREGTSQLQDGIKFLNQTLKGMLLELRGQLQNTETDSTGSILRVIDGILQNFEVQEISQGNIRELPQLYLQIPYLVDDSIANLEVVLRKLDDEDGNGKKFELNNSLLSFLVNTVNLGDIKIDLHIYQNKIACSILTEDESARNFVDSYSDELVDRLEKLDYSIQYVNCKTAKEDVKLDLFEEPPKLSGDVVKIDVIA